jgi:hypothetical protein
VSAQPDERRHLDPDVLGVAGLAATALAGFAVGMTVSRDPESLKRNARAVARHAARGIEQAALLAAQAREHLGDLWAEAREEALAEVDAADFARAAAAAPASAAPAAARRTRNKAATSAAASVPKRARAKPRGRKRPAATASGVDSASTTDADKSATA